MPPTSPNDPVALRQHAHGLSRWGTAGAIAGGTGTVGGALAAGTFAVLTVAQHIVMVPIEPADLHRYLITSGIVLVIGCLVLIAGIIALAVVRSTRKQAELIEQHHAWAYGSYPAPAPSWNGDPRGPAHHQPPPPPPFR